jgi:hypothetical protein
MDNLLEADFWTASESAEARRKVIHFLGARRRY